MLGTLVEMLSYSFMQRALLAGLFVAILAPLVGSFLVYRRMAFIGDTLAHVAFAGVAIGVYVRDGLGWGGVSPFLSALVVSALAALVIQFLADRTDAYNDVSMAIVLSGGFALGTVVISLTGGIAVSINQYIFGSISTVSWHHVRIMAALTALVGGVVAVSYKHLLYITFDESAARVARLDVDLQNSLLVVLTALVIVAAMQIMGVILVAAMLVVPVAAAGQIAPSFKASVLLSIVVAELSVFSGVTLSYTNDVAASGAIVLIAIGLYAAATVADRYVV
ncbi:zinc transport system permease protein [Natronoarchaeum philippinense]|uniref:Zinc transport system permease protein n=1 Tax=Natronoarchaeum philippinense TaxID=558529 RepID=A0A285MZW8_NATPI|nr:metal ABC transporter permease [Natronoarchaeum philippinense]SNZ02744.1 zinc transport system permease protein [Natronoarchaeum philippinense]